MIISIYQGVDVPPALKAFLPRYAGKLKIAFLARGDVQITYGPVRIVATLSANMGGIDVSIKSVSFAGMDWFGVVKGKVIGAIKKALKEPIRVGPVEIGMDDDVVFVDCVGLFVQSVETEYWSGYLILKVTEP